MPLRAYIECMLKKQRRYKSVDYDIDDMIFGDHDPGPSGR